MSEFEKLSMFDQTGKVLGESNVPDAGGALSDGSMGWSFDKYVEAAIASDKTPALQTRLELQENSGLRCAVSAQQSIKERLHKRRWDVHLCTSLLPTTLPTLAQFFCLLLNVLTVLSRIYCVLG